MKQEFYSNGKLLLTGEYVVLNGAKALALPTKKGQSLVVEPTDLGKFHWKSYDCHGEIWYEVALQTSSFFEKEAPKGNSKFDETLFAILWQALQLNPEFLLPEKGYEISTYLSFERLWGLGTSSTLISNIAQWAEVNPFELLNASFGGSGYDIASAMAKKPIFYQHSNNKNQPFVTKAPFNPIFKEQLFFVYLEEKKDSKEAIKSYRKLAHKQLEGLILKINAITEEIVICKDLNDFEGLLQEHEKLLSNFLGIATVKQERFSDFKGVVKSLGGWGGDFVLVTGTEKEMNYFRKKGYKTIIPYSEMIL